MGQRVFRFYDLNKHIIEVGENIIRLGIICIAKYISDCVVDDLCKRKIAVHNHCYTCTASGGSSCCGAVV